MSQTAVSPHKKQCTEQAHSQAQALAHAPATHTPNLGLGTSSSFKTSSTAASLAISGQCGSSSSSMASTVEPTVGQVVLRKSDEVAQIRDGYLVFGILETINRDSSDKKIKEGKVRWNLCTFSGGNYQCPLVTTENLADLTFTDRSLDKGCKVRSVKNPNGLMGICRDVLVKLDLRVLGTTTMIQGVNMDSFTHLKEFKQKSVVYKSGWLGVVTDVKRKAQIRLSSGVSCRVDLTKVLPHGPLEVEMPWINEEISAICFQPSQANFDEEESAQQSSKQVLRSIFIQDLTVESVNVLWRYQVDAMRPDKPPQKVAGARLKDLQIVMEENGTGSNFQVGNLGRFNISTQTEFRSMSSYSSNFVHRNMEPTSLTKLNEPFQKPHYAYDPNPETRLNPGQQVVVEIIHTSTLGDIIWQDGTMDWVSGKELLVQDGSLLDNILTPGDFLYSNELKSLGTVEEIYAVVTRYDLNAKKVTVKVLTCENPAKLLKTVCLHESAVTSHRRYKYFNQAYTVVVSQRDELTRIGHVRRTNPDGKVQVLWLDNRKEEWVWPAECSVYTVRGHDLDCIISLINDEDEVKEVDPQTKFSHLLRRVRRITEIWNEAIGDSSEDSNLIKLRQQSVTDLRTILEEFRQLEEEFVGNGSKSYSDESFMRFSTKIGQLIEKSPDAKDGSVQSIYAQPELGGTIISLCAEIHKRSNELGTYFRKKDTGGLRSLYSSEPMDTQPLICASALETAGGCDNDKVKVTAMDTENNLPGPSGASSSQGAMAATSNGAVDTENNQINEENNIFEPPVAVEDTHPPAHLFAKTEFQQSHLQYFLKIVRNELNNLRDQCPPGIKVKAFGDRYDLFSILIRGPEKTPYENSIYLFDAVLPPTYPAIPPKFHFHSYRAGRLNPNLYAEGRVCVSLLGTWQSQKDTEKWTKESNIVQVLLSIQALILVSEPYHNEPGLEAERYTVELAQGHCRKYNGDLMSKIMQMMINQIESPMVPWEEEIKCFYKINLPKFITRWKKWLDVASSVSTRAAFLEKLGYEKPGFEIFPWTESVGKNIKTQIEKLEKLVTKLNAGTNGDSSGGVAGGSGINMEMNAQPGQDQDQAVAPADAVSEVWEELEVDME